MRSRPAKMHLLYFEDKTNLRRGCNETAELLECRVARRVVLKMFEPSIIDYKAIAISTVDRVEPTVRMMLKAEIGELAQRTLCHDSPIGKNRLRRRAETAPVKRPSRGRPVDETGHFTKI